jgi:uncharacterized protein (TIGR03067 family)
LLVVLVGSLALVAMTASAGGDDLRKKDKEPTGKLAGVWKVVSVERNGKELSDEAVKQTKWIATETTFTANLPGEGPGEFAYKLGGTDKRGTIDIEVLRAGREGGPRKRVYLGIYSLEGDSLMLCYAPTDKDRPADFSTKAGSGETAFVLRRDKK